MKTMPKSFPVLAVVGLLILAMPLVASPSLSWREEFTDNGDKWTVRDALDITNRSYIIHLGRIIVSGDKESILHDADARNLYLGEEFRM